jgi:uncharacterized protein YhfF
MPGSSQQLCRRIVRQFPGDGKQLADLVIAGIKRGTAGLACDYGAGREPIPKVGDFVMLLDGEGRPRFIWRTTEVAIKPLAQVDETFAGDEGEGDRTRDWWLNAHRRYFARQFRTDVDRRRCWVAALLSHPEDGRVP